MFLTSPLIEQAIMLKTSATSFDLPSRTGTNGRMMGAGPQPESDTYGVEECDRGTKQCPECLTSIPRKPHAQDEEPSEQRRKHHWNAGPKVRHKKASKCRSK
jgi:hypothetical protein